MNNIVPLSIIQDIMKYEGFSLEKNKFERIKNAVFCEFLVPSSQENYLFIPFHIPILKDKLNNFLFKEIMKKNDGFLFTKKEISKEEMAKAEKSRDLLAVELLKLKQMLIELDQKLSKKTPHIIYLKAFIRYHNELQSGILEITINSNYFIERNVKNVKVKVVKEQIEENIEVEKALYENFDDLKLLGFLFHGENLNQEKLSDLLFKISFLSQEVCFFFYKFCLLNYQKNSMLKKKNI